ncbi:MAG: hypothetical protein C0507_23745 [Cyanobacteria bacterium PR.3.49]|nr:hypothetical protein [Cyanobacteria bacterium PR.3.49]
MVELRTTDASQEASVSGRQPDVLHAQDEVLLAWQSGNMRTGDLSGSISDESILANLTLYDSATEAGMLAYAETRFADMDTDGNGTVAGDELETFRNGSQIREEEIPYVRMLEERVDTMDNAYDDEGWDPTYDDNGFSRNDLLELSGHTELSASQIEFAQDNFSSLDRDGDLEITESEITDTLSEHADALSARSEMSLASLRMNLEELESMANDDGWDGGISATDLALKGNELPPEDFTAPAPAESTAAVSAVVEETEQAATDFESSRALALLTSANSTPQDQLAAVKQLFEAGQTTASITDAAGNTLNLRFDMQPVAEGSDRQFLHVFSVDESGKERVVLRALTDGDGFAQQRDAQGNFVSYVGSAWQQEYPDSVFNEA